MIVSSGHGFGLVPYGSLVAVADLVPLPLPLHHFPLSPQREATDATDVQDCAGVSTLKYT